MEGELEVSFDWDSTTIGKYFERGFYFGDYNLLSGKVSEYRYRAVSQLDCFVLTRNKFFEIIDKYDDVRQNVIGSCFQLYKETSKALVILKEYFIFSFLGTGELSFFLPFLDDQLLRLPFKKPKRTCVLLHRPKDISR
jgi:hypothetical protein